MICNSGVLGSVFSSMRTDLRQVDDELCSIVSRSSRCNLVRFFPLTIFLLLFHSVFAFHVASGDQSQELAVGSYDELCNLAAQVSREKYKPSAPLPAKWANLTYDEFRKVVFDPNKAIWRSEQLPFFLEAFHRGFVHHDQVAMYDLQASGPKAIPFRPELFDYRDELNSDGLSSDFGFAGYRIVGKFPGRSDWQELITFLGASYFRGRNAEVVYGSSARGLAVNSGLPTPEEFPVFRAHWIEKPKAGDNAITVLALLDSPSVVGAYRFILMPGVKRSSLDIRSTLFFRTIPKKVGIAPLTSMWMWGDGLPGPKEDERPEVHDADHLVVFGKGLDDLTRWNCRSLMRQNYPSLVSFPQKEIRGFGLLQRDTAATHYLDNEAKYHLRPSIWVEPTSKWGEGSLELLELPAEHEGIDNIATWWVPAQPIVVGEPISFEYRLHFDAGDQLDSQLARVVGYEIERPSNSQSPFKIGLDFASAESLAMSLNDLSLQTQCSTVRCDLLESRIEKKSEGSIRVHLTVMPNSSDPFELRVELKNGELPVSETWSYLCPIVPPPVSLPPWRQKL